MPTPQYVYPYNPTGDLPQCQINNELHAVQPPGSISDASFFAVRAGPFFASTFQLWTGPNHTGTRLVLGVDFNFTHQFIEAMQFLGVAVYGGVRFLNRNYTGNVYASYQTLGGAYTINDAALIENYTRDQYNVLLVTWSQILGLPEAFPPIDHSHWPDDLIGFPEVATALENLSTAIQALPPAGATTLLTLNTLLGNLGIGINTLQTTNPLLNVNLNNVLIPKMYFVDPSCSNGPTYKATPTSTPAPVTGLMFVWAATPTKIYQFIQGAANTGWFFRSFTVGTGPWTWQQVAIGDISTMIGSFVSAFNASDDLVSAFATALLSPDAGNELSVHANGLYKGTVAPADITNLFVDAALGDDTGIGSEVDPLRTLRQAALRGPAGVTRTIYIREGQDHMVYANAPTILRGGRISVLPYGPQVDELNVINDTVTAQAAAAALNTRIVGVGFTSAGQVPGSSFQNSVCMYPSLGALILTAGVNFVTPDIDPTGAPQSAARGFLHHYIEGGAWNIRFGTIHLSTAGSSLVCNSAFSPATLQFGNVNFTGPGKIVPVTGDSNISLSFGACTTPVGGNATVPSQYFGSGVTQKAGVWGPVKCNLSLNTYGNCGYYNAQGTSSAVGSGYRTWADWELHAMDVNSVLSITVAFNMAEPGIGGTGDEAIWDRDHYEYVLYIDGQAVAGEDVQGGAILPYVAPVATGHTPRIQVVTRYRGNTGPGVAVSVKLAYHQYQTELWPSNYSDTSFPTPPVI